jgi:hypothetical protein
MRWYTDLTRFHRLSTVYNILGGNGTARYNTFYAMVTYAAAAGKEHLAVVTPHCAHLDSMFTEWGTDLEKRRAMYTAIFDAMKKHDNRFQFSNIFGNFVRFLSL